MKTILIALIVAILSGAATFYTTLWFFNYRTELSLLEMFEVKAKCEAHFYQHCNLVYYFAPDSPVKHYLVEPERTII